MVHVAHRLESNDSCVEVLRLTSEPPLGYQSFHSLTLASINLEDWVLVPVNNANIGNTFADAAILSVH